MISSNNGEVELKGYGYEVLADLHCIVSYLKEVMSGTMGDEKAKVTLTRTFLEALSYDTKDEQRNEMMIEMLKEWR